MHLETKSAFLNSFLHFHNPKNNFFFQAVAWFADSAPWSWFLWSTAQRAWVLTTSTSWRTLWMPWSTAFPSGPMSHMSGLCCTATWLQWSVTCINPWALTSWNLPYAEWPTWGRGPTQEVPSIRPISCSFRRGLEFGKWWWWLQMARWTNETWLSWTMQCETHTPATSRCSSLV